MPVTGIFNLLDYMIDDVVVEDGKVTDLGDIVLSVE